MAITHIVRWSNVRKIGREQLSSLCDGRGRSGGNRITVERTTQGTRRDHADVELAKWTVPVWADSAAPPIAVSDGGIERDGLELETDTLTHPSTFSTVSLLSVCDG
jgi:hypothetical protein